MSILNPITDAVVLALDPALEPEHRLQSLLRLWLGKYFTGTAFTTRTSGGGTEQKTFTSCDFMWQEDVVPKNPQKPLLHIVFSNLGTQRADLLDTETGHYDRWMVEVLCKVPGNLTATPFAGKDPEHVVRKLAGEMQWILGSTERQALAVVGVQEMEIKQPPVILPGAGWAQRLMVATCLTKRAQAGGPVV